MAASLERDAVHPFGKALQVAADNANISLNSPCEFHAVSGLGLSGTFRSSLRSHKDDKEQLDQRKVWFGRLTYIMEYISLENSCLAWLERKLNEAGTRGESVAVLADSLGKIAVFCFVDQLRPEAAEALTSLQKEQTRITILTGDSLAATNTIVEKLPMVKNIEILHSLTPKLKLDFITEWSIKVFSNRVGTNSLLNL